MYVYIQLVIMIMQNYNFKKIQLITFATILFLSGCGITNQLGSTSSRPTSTQTYKKEMRNVNIFFSSTKNNENMMDCSHVDPAKRAMVFDTNMYESALRELFKGPTQEEKVQGLQPFWITEDTSSYLISATLEKETAYVNWKDIRTLIPNASASCGSQTFIMPIEKTLTQFTEIKKVVHQIEGNTDAFYEWMQYDTINE